MDSTVIPSDREEVHRRWRGTDKTKHDTLDAYFVAQHNNKECSMKWKYWQIWEMFTQSTSSKICN